MKNILLKILTSWLRLFIKAKKGERFERFLIVSTTGLGDTLWATPAIRALRSRYPSAYIALLTSPVGASVLKDNPYIDEIFVISDPVFPSLFKLYKALKKRVIDTALIFHTSQRPMIPLCHWIGAKEIIGTQGLCKGLDDLLTIAVPAKKEHEITRRLAIVAELDVSCQSLAMEIFLKEEDDLKAARLLKDHCVPDYLPLVGLHPGAKDLFKQWFPEGFISVGKRLAEERGCQIIVTGNQAERALVDKIAQSIPRAIAVHGQLSISELAALQKRMNLLITNDTGPMHLASAVGTPLLALFGPTDPALCGPFIHPNTRIIKIEPSCSPCLKKRCLEPFCLLQIGPNDVFNRAIEILDAKSVESVPL